MYTSRYGLERNGLNVLNILFLCPLCLSSKFFVFKVFCFHLQFSVFRGSATTSRPTGTHTNDKHICIFSNLSAWNAYFQTFLLRNQDVRDPKLIGCQLSRQNSARLDVLLCVRGRDRQEFGYGHRGHDERAQRTLEEGESQTDLLQVFLLIHLLCRRIKTEAGMRLDGPIRDLRSGGWG